MPKQFLTAVFEMRPTRRKAAALERVRADAEAVKWEAIAAAQGIATATIAIADEAARKKRIIDAAPKLVTPAAARRNLSEPVVQGLIRDVGASLSSFVEKSVEGGETGYPQPAGSLVVHHHAALDRLATATRRVQTDEAAADLRRTAKTPRPTPITIARSRDAMIVRDDRNRLWVVLNILSARDPRARQARILNCVDAVSGEILQSSARGRKTILIVPLACSRWHENKFLSGKATLKSAQVMRDGARWFLAAQFAFEVASRPVSGAVLGIDRGCVYPIAASVVAADGAVIEVPGLRGAEIGAVITRTERKRADQQRRTERTRLGHARSVDHMLHRLTNELVSTAVRHGARVAIEKLDGLKSMIVRKRPAGARRNPWQKTLKKAQLGKIEVMLRYKLPLAGLSVPKEVLAQGTSISCIACGHRAKENRMTRDTFVCVACRYRQHADISGSVVVARRGLMKPQKGVRLDDLHRDMVASLTGRDDGGLGPLTDGRQRVVAAHATAALADRPNLEADTLAAGQKAILLANQNPP